MYRLIIKKDMRPKGFKHLAFLNPSQEESFINAYIPFSERANNPFMGRSIAGGNSSRSDRHLILWKFLLQKR
jgi:hypothetical protein